MKKRGRPNRGMKVIGYNVSPATRNVLDQLGERGESKSAIVDRAVLYFASQVLGVLPKREQEAE